DDRRVLQLREDPRLRRHAPLEQLVHARGQIGFLARRLDDHRAADPAAFPHEELRHAAARDRLRQPAQHGFPPTPLPHVARDGRPGGASLAGAKTAAKKGGEWLGTLGNWAGGAAAVKEGWDWMRGNNSGGGGNSGGGSAQPSPAAPPTSD